MSIEITIKSLAIFAFFLLFFLLFYIFGKKAIIFKNTTIDQLHLYYSILLYRGYTERRNTPDGRLYIYDLNRRRYVLIKKYRNIGNRKGLYMFVPIFDEHVRSEIVKILEKNHNKKLYWFDSLLEIDNEVIGVDMEMDISWGVEFFKSIADTVFLKDPNDVRLKLYFKNVRDDMTKFEDFSISTIDLSKFDSDLMMPVKNATKVAAKLGKLTRKVKEYFAGIARQ